MLVAMDFSSDDDLLIEQSLFFKLKSKQVNKKIHPINLGRKAFGEFHHLFDELRQDEKKFLEYTRMKISTFDYILIKNEPLIIKNWTNFNKTPIMPAERLIVTLR